MNIFLALLTWEFLENKNRTHYKIFLILFSGQTLALLLGQNSGQGERCMYFLSNCCGPYLIYIHTCVYLYIFIFIYNLIYKSYICILYTDTHVYIILYKIIYLHIKIHYVLYINIFIIINYIYYLIYINLIYIICDIIILIL